VSDRVNFLNVTLAEAGIGCRREKLKSTANAFESLPPHYKDPFDRLMIAQAMIEAIPVVSVDTEFDAYPVTRLR
jgi:PIN domain nuclease of toxin-antitoxin system